jgi:hypothetical protein
MDEAGSCEVSMRLADYLQETREVDRDELRGLCETRRWVDWVLDQYVVHPHPFLRYFSPTLWPYIPRDYWRISS